jgi:hypothetical protein
MYKSGKNKYMAVGPEGTETKNDCTDEAQQQFTGMDWTGRGTERERVHLKMAKHTHKR